MEIAQHLITNHPQLNDNDFTIISNNLQTTIDKNAQQLLSTKTLSIDSSSTKNQISSTPTPTEKDFITEDDIKSERLDADNSEEDYPNEMDTGDDIEQNTSSNFNILCPLCQDSFSDKKSLEKHVMNIHSVNTDGLARLLNLVDTSHWLNSNSGGGNGGGSGGTSSKMGKLSSSSTSSCTDNTDIECMICGTAFKSMSDLFMHANELQHFQLFGNNSELCMCILRTCHQQFNSLSTMINHFKDCHMNAVISERHVYKYRCKLCSLAFKTQEKLNVHSLYHTMREATKCHLCSRNFRSLASLQKHMEQFHQGATATVSSSPVTSPSLEKSTEYLDDYQMVGSPASSTKQDDNDLDRSIGNVADDQSSNATDVIAETSEIDDYLNSQTMAEENFNDPIRKFKCTKCKLAFTTQIYLQQHLKTNLHRRNAEKVSSYPLEKYLDPNRPFKCDICRESFTQKNILLVHYNSVSHLHKLKKQNENNTPSTSPTVTAGPSSLTSVEFDRRSIEYDRKSVDFDRKSVDLNDDERESQKRKLSPENDYDSPKKRFKCDICRVAYAQGSTLDIHMRSVLHQTRACRLQEQQIQQQISPNLLSGSHTDLNSISPTPSTMSATGGNDLSDVLKSASGSSKFNNQIYKTLLENFGFDIVKQFNEINKNPMANFLTGSGGSDNNLAANMNAATLAQTLNANLHNAAAAAGANTGNGEKNFYCRQCKIYFKNASAYDAHCENMHNERSTHDLHDKFISDKFKTFGLVTGDSSQTTTIARDRDEILDYSTKKQHDNELFNQQSQILRSSITVNPLAKLTEQQQQQQQQSSNTQNLSLEQLSQQLNIDPGTLAHKMMEQNLAAAANFPQAFGLHGGLQNLQNLSNLPGLQNLPNLTGNAASLNTIDMLSLMQFHQLMSLNFMNLAPPLIFGATNNTESPVNPAVAAAAASNLGRSTSNLSSSTSTESLANAQKVQLLQQQAAAVQQVINIIFSYFVFFQIFISYKKK